MVDITFEDLTGALEARAPDFAERVVAMLEQTDPPEDRPEDASELVDDAQEWPPLPDGTWTLARLKSATSEGRLADKTPGERKNIRREAFEGLLAAPYPPPRLRLGALLSSLYTNDDEWARSQLMTIFKEGRLGYGVWQAFKSVFKQAEIQHDAAMFGVLAYRLDAYQRTPHTKEISPGTIKYMRRRAWRYLRRLGESVPELFPSFAVQVLQHYPAGFRFGGAWVAHQIWAHADMIGVDVAPLVRPPEDLSRRAFDETWKLSPDPLLRLLEDAANDVVCDFAIRGLKQDFPKRLRSVDAEWLRRIARKSSASVHTFLIEALTDSPEYHQSRLRGLGLHRTVLDLLKSDSSVAREYAIKYAQAHAPDIDVQELIELACDGMAEVRAFAVDRIQDRSGAAIGLPGLVRLIIEPETRAIASDMIERSFRPTDLSAELFFRLTLSSHELRRFVGDWHEREKTPLPVRLLLSLVEHPKANHAARRWAFSNLDKRPGAEIGVDWFKKALLEPQLASRAAQWLRAGKLAGPDLDVEWMKGLVMRPSLRPLALDLLGDRALVSPDRVGLSWLLAMLRHPDENVQQFAHRYMLEHFAPEDFEGVDRLWALASERQQPEAVRRFAAAYLKAHHPQARQIASDEAALAVKARLDHASFALIRVRSSFEDERPDVRQLAVAVAKYEIVRWGDQGLLYDLAASRFREPRRFAADTLVAVGEPTADPDRIPPKSWLLPDRIFALTEHSSSGTRELALNLIVKHYDLVGGPQRLAYLLDSPDRDVRAFAVRLLWDRHRPRRPISPKASNGDRAQSSATESVRFDSVEALRHFLRTVMFGLPPGRGARTDDKMSLAIRPLSASIAKRRLIAVVRDLALEDGDFARLVTPILEEFSHSVAKGEWQACVTALVRIQRAHPELSISVGEPVPWPTREAR